MDKRISKKERDYILFNIRGFFRHYKIEQNINKISIDISNLQKLTEEVNNLLSDLNEINKEVLNSNNIMDNHKGEELTKQEKSQLSEVFSKTEFIFKISCFMLSTSLYVGIIITGFI